MANNLYSALEASVPESFQTRDPVTGDLWYGVSSDRGMGMCMYVPQSRCAEIARYNAYWNHGSRYEVPFEYFYTAGMDFHGKTVGVVGHLKQACARHRSEARNFYVFELNPKDNLDLPAEREDELLPQCDIVIITGSALVNGTLPHILELCPDAYTVLTGPSVPKWDGLLDFGINRLAGFCITREEDMRSDILSCRPGSPYRNGTSFLIL